MQGLNPQKLTHFLSNFTAAARYQRFPDENRACPAFTQPLNIRSGMNPAFSHE